MVIQPELPKNGDESSAANGAAVKTVKLNKDHNLEWTLQIPANEQRELVIKWKVEHPAQEKIEFRQQ